MKMIADAPAFVEKVSVVIPSAIHQDLENKFFVTGKYQIENQDYGQPGLNHVYLGVYTLAASCSRGNNVVACSAVD